MKFSSYFVLSSLVVIGIITHAYVAHEQWYPAVVYLSTDKMCLAFMYNFAFALFLLFGKVLLRLFIGTLRDVEVEQLVDSGRGFLADTILFLVFYAPTIDNREVTTVYLIQYICCVIFMKVFHLTTQIRVSHMFEVGVPRLIVNLKLVALMCLLLFCDFMALQYFYSVASRSSTFFTWILFEALTMSTVVLVSLCKYSVHMVDLRLENGWPGKSVCLFYIDLVHDVVSMTLFLVFMLTFFVQNPSRLPIYMMADVIQVARKLAQRLRSFRRYRRISNNMEMRFADATDEEIQQNEQCVICRDSLFDGSKAKKLVCGHIFHIDCLRSWFVMQQVCPTCRAEIPADGPPAVQASTWRAAAAPEAAAAPRAETPAAPAAAAATAPQGNSEVAAAAAVSATRTTGAQHAASPGVSAAGASINGTSVAQQEASKVLSSAVPSAAAASAPAATAATTGPGLLPGAPGAAQAMPAGGFALGSLGSLTPVSEITEALKRAEELSKFLRQQSDFWMEQVRLIERNHLQQTSGAQGAPGWPSFGDPSSFAAPWLQFPLLGPGGQPGGFGVAAGSAEQALCTEAAVGDDAGPCATSSGSGSGAPAAADAEARQQPVLSESSTSTSDLQTQMAQLRRAQQEQWERKRTAATLAAGSGASASPTPPPSS